MDSFIQKARLQLAKLTKKPVERDDLADEAADGDLRIDDQKGRKKKDHTIFVHPLLRKEFDDVITPPRSPSSKDPHKSPQQNSSSRVNSLKQTSELNGILKCDPVDMRRLRDACWGGCPTELRYESWCLLTGYHTSQHGPRNDILRRKRHEYLSYLRVYENVDWDLHLGDANASALSSSDAVVGAEEISMMKQIRKDVPRSSGGVAFLQHRRVMLSLERVLFTWALRHPACGYVQGMNDLVLPFFYVALSTRFLPSKNPSDLAARTFDEVTCLFSEENCSSQSWMETESDLYWMCSMLLNGLQENFTYNQAGVHALVRKLEAIVGASEPHLLSHFRGIGVSFEQFAFRWMNCLLVREFEMHHVLRLLDTYLAEESGNVGKLHVFICASLLARWTSKLCEIDDFGSTISFLQNPPTAHYKDRDMDELISEGFLKQQLYENSNSVRISK